MPADVVWILIMLLIGTNGMSMDHLMLYTEMDCLAAAEYINEVKPKKIWGEDAKLYVKCIPMKGVVD